MLAAHVAEVVAEAAVAEKVVAEAVVAVDGEDVAEEVVVVVEVAAVDGSGVAAVAAVVVSSFLFLSAAPSSTAKNVANNLPPFSSILLRPRRVMWTSCWLSGKQSLDLRLCFSRSIL